MKLEQIANTLKMQPDPVLAQKVQQQDPMQSAIAASLLQQRQQQRAAAAPQQVAPIAQQPPVTQGLYPMIVQAAQNLQRQQAQAPTQGLGAVEPPVMMASGGIVSFQGGGDVLRQRLRNARARLELYGTRQRIADPEGYAAALKEYQELLSQSRGPEEPKEPEEPEPTPGEVEAASRPFFGGRPVLPVGSRVPLPPSRLDAAPPIEVTGTPRLSPQRPPAAPAGPRPPSTARPAVPGGVTMTTPEMGPPRPDAGIASLVPAAQEPVKIPSVPLRDLVSPLRELYEEAKPAEPKTVEQLMDEQLALEAKYGIRPKGQNLLETKQRQLERTLKEREQIPEQVGRAIIEGMQGRDLASMLGGARAAGYGTRRVAEESSKQAELILEQAVALLKDGIEDEKRGKLEDARKKFEASENLMRQYKMERAKGLTGGFTKAQELQVQEQDTLQRAQRTAMEDLRQRQLEADKIKAAEKAADVRFGRDVELEKLRQSGRVGVGGAGSGLGRERLTFQQTQKINEAIENEAARLSLTREIRDAKLTPQQIKQRAMQNVMNDPLLGPVLRQLLQEQGGAAGQGAAPSSVGSYDPSKPADQRVRLPNQ